MTRISEHFELALTEVLLRTDNEIGRAHEDTEKGVPGAKGRLAQAEARHAEVSARRDRRRGELERQAAIPLQGVERLASVLILPASGARRIGGAAPPAIARDRDDGHARSDRA